MEIVKQNRAAAEITKRVILLLKVSSPWIVAHLQMVLKPISEFSTFPHSVKQNYNK